MSNSPQPVRAPRLKVQEKLFQLTEDMVLHRIRLSYDALAEGKKRGAMPEEMLKELG